MAVSLARWGRAADVAPRRASVAQPGRIRRLGPFVALGVPGGLIGVAMGIYLWWPCSDTGCVQPTLFSGLLLLFAAPTSLIAGLPWLLTPVNIGAAAGTSLVMWMLLGRWAGRRATADVDATWWTYWVEMSWMAGGVWAGVVGGLLAMYFLLTI